MEIPLITYLGHFQKNRLSFHSGPLADILHQAFLVNLIAEAESQIYEEGFDSEHSSSARG